MVKETLPHRHSQYTKWKKDPDNANKEFHHFAKENTLRLEEVTKIL